MKLRSIARLAWSRTGFLILTSAVLLAAIAAAAALATLAGANRLERTSADGRASLSSALLVRVGAVMPNLTPHLVHAGLSVSQVDQLSRAIGRGERQGLISNLTIWNARGQLVYTRDGENDLNQADERPWVEQALGGHQFVKRDPKELDLSTGLRTGTLDAFEPLKNAAGHVFGVTELKLPLRPIERQSSSTTRTILLAAAVIGLLVWILLLPVTVRLARAAARAWEPGRRRVLRAFRHALQADQIELVFQPQIDPQHGGLDAVEALVRWRRGGELKLPCSFLPFVEGTPLMARLTDRVIELAAAQLAAWRTEGMRIRVSINLSADNLSDNRVVAMIRSVLDRYDIPGTQLTVEVTETAILKDPFYARQVLEQLTELGVEVSVDDFGTGHSSVSKLQQLPVREVKLDRSFVSLNDARSRSYLSALLRFGQGLGLRVVAEGVEDGDTLVYLRRLGCDLVQGNYVSAPIEADEIPRWRSRGAVLTHPETISLAAV